MLMPNAFVRQGSTPRVFINGRFFNQRVTGVQRYARETASYLSQLLAYRLADRDKASVRRVRWRDVDGGGSSRFASLPTAEVRPDWHKIHPNVAGRRKLPQPGAREEKNAGVVFSHRPLTYHATEAGGLAVHTGNVEFICVGPSSRILHIEKDIRMLSPEEKPKNRDRVLATFGRRVTSFQVDR